MNIFKRIKGIVMNKYFNNFFSILTLSLLISNHAHAAGAKPLAVSAEDEADISCDTKLKVAAHLANMGVALLTDDLLSLERTHKAIGAQLRELRAQRRINQIARQLTPEERNAQREAELNQQT